MITFQNEPRPPAEPPPPEPPPVEPPKPEPPPVEPPKPEPPPVEPPERDREPVEPPETPPPARALGRRAAHVVARAKGG